uniref:Glycosyltransferase 1 domain containing protein n=1 Tax=Echinococcus granulosus TaxID=6210 RepID=A0A068WV56_ECHGR|nr:glycosyltransferase 1 domain containing protein [Echinococcus granulosus]
MSEAISRSSAVVTFSVLVNRPEAVDNRNMISMIESQLHTKLDSFFLFVGRLRPIKDPKYILQPFLELARDRSTRHLQLLYVGSVEEDCDEIQSFLSEVDKHESIHWMASIPQPQVHALMTAAICLINSSLSEGQPLSIMEAMTLGCPVVARNISANKDLIDHGETGLIFDSPYECKGCLERLLADDALYRSISQKATEKMHQHEFQLHTEATAYLKLVNDIQMKKSNHKYMDTDL